MNATFQLDISADDGTETKRELNRRSLNEIAVDVTAGLREANLSHQVYLVVPASGNALVSMMTPDDPSDLDWKRIGDIVRKIISERLDGTQLRNSELSCTMVNAAMSATEITAD